MRRSGAVWVWGDGHNVHLLNLESGRSIARVRVEPGYLGPLAGVGKRVGRRMVAVYRSPASDDFVVQHGSERLTVGPGVSADYVQTCSGFRSSLTIQQPGSPTIHVHGTPVKGAVRQRLARIPWDYDIGSDDRLARIAQIIQSDADQWSTFSQHWDPSGGPWDRL